MSAPKPLNAKELQTKWATVLDCPELAPIHNSWKKACAAVILESTAYETRGQLNPLSQLIQEDIPANVANGFPTNSDLKGYDPVLIAMVRRALPQMIAFDVCGVQPMNGPTGLIFALKSRYDAQNGDEALHFEADTAYAGTGTHSDPLDPTGSVTAGSGLSTYDGEKLGTGSPEPEFADMALSIAKVTVTAKTRALKAEYTLEIAQDLKAIHGIDVETELANILSAECLAEINREVIREIYRCAERGAQHNTAVAGTFNLDTDSNGRWMVEKFKGLYYQIERDANQIAKRTRRGKGNFIICSSDVASALSMAGKLDVGMAMGEKLNVDETQNTFVGVLDGKYKVFVDPYALNNVNFAVVGFKGSNQYDAGMFYAPYVPMSFLRAQDPNAFFPKIGVKTRYGLVAHPFSNLAGDSDGTLSSNVNCFYRKMTVSNLM